ncbi:MAG TPA: RNA polymerase sigma factor [Microbacteriaceae bacterium]|nr:RNA polymerase sigma factor [Microbacteriaceae bacterium]
MGESLTDEVVAQARTGNASAFGVIYQELSPAVLGYLTAKGVDDPEAVTNDVFLAVLPQLGRLRGGVAGLRKFVFTIAHARMVDDTRRTSRRPPSGEYVAELDGRASESAETVALQSIEADRVMALMDRLAADQREVLLLRLVADLPLAQAAQVIGKSGGAVKQLQRRGLIALRKLIEQEKEGQS